MIQGWKALATGIVNDSIFIDSNWPWFIDNTLHVVSSAMCYQIYRETNIRVNETATIITYPSILVLSSDKTYRRVIKKESFKNIRYF